MSTSRHPPAPCLLWLDRRIGSSLSDDPLSGDVGDRTSSILELLLLEAIISLRSNWMMSSLVATSSGDLPFVFTCTGLAPCRSSISTSCLKQKECHSLTLLPADLFTQKPFQLPMKLPATQQLLYESCSFL